MGNTQLDLCSNTSAKNSKRKGGIIKEKEKKRICRTDAVSLLTPTRSPSSNVTAILEIRQRGLDTTRLLLSQASDAIVLDSSPALSYHQTILYQEVVRFSRSQWRRLG